jgi:hypothetical protein
MHTLIHSVCFLFLSSIGVLADTVQERSDVETPWPMPKLIAVLGNLQRYGVIGLEDTHELVAKEWEGAESWETNESYGITVDREIEEMASSEFVLQHKG